MIESGLFVGTVVESGSRQNQDTRTKKKLKMDVGHARPAYFSMVGGYNIVPSVSLESCTCMLVTLEPDQVDPPTPSPPACKIKHENRNRNEPN